MSTASIPTPSASTKPRKTTTRVLLVLLILVTSNWLWTSWRAGEIRFFGLFIEFKSSMFVFPRGDTKLYFMDAKVFVENSDYGFIDGKEVEWTFWNTEDHAVEFEFPEQVLFIEDSRGYTGKAQVKDEFQNQKFSIEPNEKKVLRFKWDRLLVSNPKGRAPEWVRFYPLIKVNGQSVVYASPTGDNVKMAPQ